MKKIWKFDLRMKAIKYPKITIVIFSILTGIILWGNYKTPQGSVIPKDAIMNKDNPVRKMDEYVSSKKAEGFNPAEPIIFPIKFGKKIGKKEILFPNGIQSKEDLKKIYEWTNRLKDEFGESVISLATIPNFLDEEGELKSEYYINSSLFKSNSGLNIGNWKKGVIADQSVYGIFISQDFKMAYIYYFVDDDAEQMSLMWKVKCFLEEKTFGWIHQFTEFDIHPKDASIGLASWIAGRWIIHQALLLNILMIIRFRYFLN